MFENSLKKTQFMVNDKLVQKYRKLLSTGRYTREMAAAKAGMSAKTARKWETGPMPSEIPSKRGPRTWRTRKDDFAEHWESIVLPELQADKDGVFEATFLFEYLRGIRPDYDDSKLRTFQRRVTDYRALHGPPKEAFFAQTYRPGERAQLDFTRIDSLGITIAGSPLGRMLFESILCYSGHRHVALVPSESYEALSVGVQGAFSAWGGAPPLMFHDHLSAAIHNLKGENVYEVNTRYVDLLAQYGCEPRFIEVAKPNQNGCVERGHGVLKNILRQALKLRRSSDFQSLEQFERFLAGIVDKLNRRRHTRWEEERKKLLPLPQTPPTTYSELAVTVSRWSLIQVRNNTYSVPSRLIGAKLNVRLHLETLELYYKNNLIETMPRLVGRGCMAINYRHLIHSLVRKPGAFANYRYREQMFPTLAFREAYDSLLKTAPGKSDIEYLRILKLAADNLQCDVEAALRLHLDEKSPISHKAIEELIVAKAKPMQTLRPQAPNLQPYNDLLSGGLREQLAA